MTPTNGAKKPDATQAAMKEKLINNEIGRNVRREMGKYALDCSKVTVAVRRGTVSLFGKIAPLNGKESIYEDEVKSLLKALHALPHVHNVVRP